MKKVIILILFGMLLINLISAEIESLPTQKIDTNIELKQIGADFTSCNITSISYPNSTIITLDKLMTKRGNEYNYTLISNYTGVLGKYIVNGFCTNGSDDIVWAYDLEVTPSGTELSTAQGIFYIIFLVVAFFIFWISIYGSFKISWRNTRNDEGQIVSVNDLKWLKLFLMVFSYLTFMFIMVMTYNITENFIYIGGVSDYFYYVYLISLSFFFPIMVLMPWVVIYILFQDKKVKKLIQRGLPMR